MAHEAHSCVLWDPGVHAEEEMERLTPILRNVDYLIPNWLEVEKLTKTRDIHEMGEKMSLVSPTTKIIIKQGSKGATLIGGMEISSVSGFSLEGSGMRAMNTVGCGDAFIGAFAAFKTMRYDDSESIRWANCAGAYNATQPKTRGSPTREQLKDFYRMYYQSKGR
jgi:sugar/nucleoside kinase (ribokinase family)